MKAIKKSVNYLFYALCSLSIPLAAQNAGERMIENNVSDPDDILMMAAPRTMTMDAEGSPYITEDFVPAQINTLKKTHLVRYDAHLDQFEVQNSNGIMVLSKEKPYTVRLKNGSNTTYINLTYQEKGEDKNGYFIDLGPVVGSKHLYKKEAIQYVKGRLAKSSLEQDIPPRYKRSKDAFYYAFGDNKALLEVPTSRKSMIKACGNPAMKKYLSKNNIDLKKAQDLQKALKQCDTAM